LKHLALSRRRRRLLRSLMLVPQLADRLRVLDDGDVTRILGLLERVHLLLELLCSGSLRGVLLRLLWLLL